MSYIQKIRQQPHHKKIRLIWICSGVVALLLLVLWALTWHFRKAVPSDTGLFDTLGRGVHDLKNNYNKPIQ
jgi:hypothetical protein